MDWIEEKIEKLKEYLKNAGLVKSMICYLCITSIGAVVLWLFTRNICDIWIQVISMRIENVHYYTLKMGGRLVVSKNTEYDIILRLCSFLYNYSLWIYMFIAYIIAGKIFCKRNLSPALNTISDMLGALNAGDYSREIVYRSQDEMGKISGEIEELRKKLLREKRRQWEKQEEQRNINAVFAHDIRTPLTTIRGYTEFLQKYIPRGKVTQEMLMEKLNTIQYQEERLLRFSNTMTELQRIEKRELSCSWIRFADFVQHLHTTIEAIEQTGGKRIALYVANDVKENEVCREIFADSECILEVVENLLNNAVRYAKNQISVQLKLEKTELMLYIKDDGAGFSQKALRMASKAYFSEEKEKSEHFGIGLSICKMLCETHNGTITFRNSIEGGAIVGVTFGLGVREF